MSQGPFESTHQADIFGPFMDDFPIETSIYRGFSSQPCLMKPEGTNPYFHHIWSVFRSLCGSGPVRTRAFVRHLGGTLEPMIPTGLISFPDPHRGPPQIQLSLAANPVHQPSFQVFQLGQETGGPPCIVYLLCKSHAFLVQKQAISNSP